MSIMMHLSLIPGVDKLINSNQELRDKITKLAFPQKVDFKDFDWSKTTILVAGDPTTKVWVENTVKEISVFLSKQPNNGKPSIVYLGGNNGKYKPARWYQILRKINILRKLETQFATNICYVNGYQLTPFIYGFESEIVHQEVEKQVPDSVFNSVKLETKSTNIHASMENAYTEGYLDNVKNLVIVAGKEYATRCIGTLRATLKSHGFNYTDYNIVAWPYTKNLSVEKSVELRELMGISYKLPKEENNPLIVDENNWYKSALSLYDVAIETDSLIKYANKGHVELTDDQKELADYISKKLTKKNKILETVKVTMSELKKKVANPIIQKIMGDKQKG